tara:strand:+ start:897 stop:1496 length:600 start_codon:yes stop_codon:yes gene_type:complete
MTAMERVLANADLVNHVFCCIADPQPFVACCALKSWYATSRTIRDACKAHDEKKVWVELLEAAFGEFLHIDSAALSNALLIADKHPQIYVEALCEASRHCRRNPHDYLPHNWVGPIRAWARGNAFAYYMCMQETAYHKARREAMDRYASLGVTGTEHAEFPTLLYWVKCGWQSMEPWWRAVVVACQRVELAHATAWNKK